MKLKTKQIFQIIGISISCLLLMVLYPIAMGYLIWKVISYEYILQIVVCILGILIVADVFLQSYYIIKGKQNK